MIVTSDIVARPPLELRGKRVWVSGHRGMVGSALVRRLAQEDCTLLIADRTEVDLTSQAATGDWMRRERPEIVFAAAGRVGGIVANATYPAEFLYENLMIAANVIHAAHQIGVEKLLYLGSSCIYPRDTGQPIREDQLLTGALEKTNEAYAIAKIAGVKLVESYARQYGCRFISAMPTNLYGPHDNFDLETAHVLPALIHRIHEAKVRGQATVEIWGSGRPCREFLHVDDLADACILAMRRYEDPTPINIGTGSDVSVADLALLVAKAVGYTGAFAFDTQRPDGTPRKLLDVGRITRLGWQARIDLDSGIRNTYRWWLDEARRTGRDDRQDGERSPSGRSSIALALG